LPDHQNKKLTKFTIYETHPFSIENKGKCTENEGVGVKNCEFLFKKFGRRKKQIAHPESQQNCAPDTKNRFVGSHFYCEKFLFEVQNDEKVLKKFCQLFVLMIGQVIYGCKADKICYKIGLKEKMLTLIYF